jgi:hypothetical protein
LCLKFGVGAIWEPIGGLALGIKNPPTRVHLSKNHFAFLRFTLAF